MCHNFMELDETIAYDQESEEGGVSSVASLPNNFSVVVDFQGLEMDGLVEEGPMWFHPSQENSGRSVEIKGQSLQVVVARKAKKKRVHPCPVYDSYFSHVKNHVLGTHLPWFM